MRDDDFAQAFLLRAETASPRREAADRDGVNLLSMHNRPDRRRHDIARPD
jgi:hypothetical protein